VPVQYAKRIIGNKQYGGARQYIPLKVNAANVMPIIFAQAIMFIPITFIGFSNVNDAGGFLHAFTDHTSFWYNFVFAVMIILFTYFYTAITINPTQMAEDMKRNNGFIPGIKPGKKTAEYIDDIMSRITLPGSFFLALVAIMPAFAGIFGVQAGFAQFFGGTSLLKVILKLPYGNLTPSIGGFLYNIRSVKTYLSLNSGCILQAFDTSVRYVSASQLIISQCLPTVSTFLNLLKLLEINLLTFLNFILM
jgi:hypothetical protein